MKRTILIFISLLVAVCAFSQEPTLIHPWQGKKVAYLGDSITDPNVKTTSKHYWELLAEWLGQTPFVYAVSGRQWNDIPRQTQQLKREHADDVDAIIVFIGTNDFNAAVPLGEWFDEKEEEVLAAVHGPKAMVKRVKREPNTDQSTYKGRINKAIQTLKQTYPTKQIVILTPIHRAFATFGEQNIQPSEAYQNAIGEWFSSYVDAVKEAGNIWSVPVVDINALSGLYPLMPEFHHFFGNPSNDQLHPNDAGHVRIARTLYYQLLTLPCSF